MINNYNKNRNCSLASLSCLNKLKFQHIYTTCSRPTTYDISKVHCNFRCWSAVPITNRGCCRNKINTSLLCWCVFLQKYTLTLYTHRVVAICNIVYILHVYIHCHGDWRTHHANGVYTSLTFNTHNMSRIAEWKE